VDYSLTIDSMHASIFAVIYSVGYILH